MKEHLINEVLFTIMYLCLVAVIFAVSYGVWALFFGQCK